MATRAFLRFRGYPIEELAEKCKFLEVAWLLIARRTRAKEKAAAGKSASCAIA